MNKLGPILLIILAIGLFFGYINPTYTNQVAAVKQQIQSYDSALDAAAAFTQKENDLLGKKNSIPADQMARLTEFLPDGVDNVQLILDLNSLASRSGVLLSNFNVTSSPDTTTPANSSSGGTVPLQASTPIRYIDLSVEVTGTYAGFRQFLGATEQSLRPLDVTHVDIKTTQTGVDTFDISFRIYWLH